MNVFEEIKVRLRAVADAYASEVFTKPSEKDIAQGKSNGYLEAIDIISALEKEYDGRVIVLPCEANELVWVARLGEKPHEVLFASASGILSDIEHGYVIGHTKEEAEQALAEMQKER